MWPLRGYDAENELPCSQTSGSTHFNCRPALAGNGKHGCVAHEQQLPTSVRDNCWSDADRNISRNAESNAVSSEQSDRPSAPEAIRTGTPWNPVLSIAAASAYKDAPEPSSGAPYGRSHNSNRFDKACGGCGRNCTGDKARGRDHVTLRSQLKCPRCCFLMRLGKPWQRLSQSQTGCHLQTLPTTEPTTVSTQ